MADQRSVLEDVNKLADAAGLVNRKGLVQVLQFSHNPNNDECKLLELPHRILDTLKVGNSVTIRGDHQDEAVLCTDKETYDLKVADTSNSLLLVPDCVLPKDEAFKSEVSPLVFREVSSCYTTYFELKQRRPKLEKLKFLLVGDLYKGPENEENTGHLEDDSVKKRSLHTLADLLSKVQASETEILEALKKIEALEINAMEAVSISQLAASGGSSWMFSGSQAYSFSGHWRLLDTDYKEKVVIGILTLLEEKDWSYEAVPVRECCDILQELEPRIILEHCLNCYGEVTNMETDSGDENTVYYRLSEDKICRFYAEYLLRQAGRFNYHEFMDSWQQSVPEGMVTKSAHLAGIALTDMQSIPPVIWHFPASDLPDDPVPRDLAAPGQSLNALLMKFARSSTDATGVKVYNSKKAT
ncbi:Sister chromatid cohesion protein DCC1 [Acropora cervicornis]|uniref:Sister chromatid cohesion protein DCC1 n=1 Tax=Acropora cervicornis TaxID=6130 RepID=A0AAD9QJG1_ACRCE|nr:Sister chromatid cohesion protein DCC1 [Acropora cervicornis]